jgi:hypothetical protein|tara:strand:+ start:162 stop:404 length:243 start_codon:yes stop_codon:yes gene_type:complete
MSTENMPTIYDLVGDVCGRDFSVLAKLSHETQTKFIDIIYDDVMNGDSPHKITEQQIYQHVEETIAKAVGLYLDDFVDIT